MNTKWSLVAAVCVALFVCACGSGPAHGTGLLSAGSSSSDSIVGKWETDGAFKMALEFSGDGTAKLTMLGQTAPGTYKLNGDDLEWTMNGKTTKSKAKVTAAQLDVTDGDGETITYKRK